MDKYTNLLSLEQLSKVISATKLGVFSLFDLPNSAKSTMFSRGMFPTLTMTRLWDFRVGRSLARFLGFELNKMFEF